MLVTGFFEILDEQTISIGGQDLEIKPGDKVLEPGFYGGMVSIGKDWSVYISRATAISGFPRQLIQKFKQDCTYFQCTGFTKITPSVSKAGKEFCLIAMEMYKPKKEDRETFAYTVSAATGAWAQTVNAGTITARGKIVPYKDSSESDLPRAKAAVWEIALEDRGAQFSPASWGTGLVFSDRIDFKDPEIITIGETFESEDEDFMSVGGLE